jgi:hypothetical protein
VSSDSPSVWDIDSIVKKTLQSFSAGEVPVHQKRLTGIKQLLAQVSVLPVLFQAFLPPLCHEKRNDENNEQNYEYPGPPRHNKPP